MKVDSVGWWKVEGRGERGGVEKAAGGTHSRGRGQVVAT